MKAAGAQIDVPRAASETSLFQDHEELCPVRRQTPYCYSKLAPAKPTEVFDSYWYLAAERQNIFFRRLSGQPSPWTGDRILSSKRFTNAYRVLDRVSQFAVRHVIYSGSQSADEVFFRLLLFKFFNKIETWELITENFGTPSIQNFSVQEYSAVLTEAQLLGRTIFSGAYIMPSHAPGYSHKRKHVNYLQLLKQMVSERLPDKLHRCASFREAFCLLRSYPLIGDFLAYQYAIDLNYSEVLNFSENDFVVAGPGARSGIRKCFLDPGGYSEAELIKMATDRQEEIMRDLGLPFQSLWDRKLHLIDCQNLFCEVDKYAREAHPHIGGIGDRLRIKQRFGSSKRIDKPWFPPKWGLNEKVRVSL